MMRKAILCTVGLLLSFALLFAGGAKEAPEAAVAAEVGSEAPMLAEMVARGELPPLEQRLPVDPLVLEPVDRIGEYGGTWRRAVLGGADGANFTRTVLYNWLLRWAPDWSGVIPNIAKSFTVSDDSTAFTFQLREGMKWSDGEPFTSDDVRFWYEAVFTNTDLNPAGPRIAGVTLTDLEVHDEYSVTFHFESSVGLFLQWLAAPGGNGPVIFARHYFEQFHIDYNPDVEELAEAEGFGTWIDLFDYKNDLTVNTDQPSLSAWVVTAPYDGTTTEVRFERNPYFWKVDTAGNQLPYLDRVVFDVLQDGEVLLLRTLEGQYDMIGRHVANVANRPVLFQEMDRGNYRFIDTVSDGSNTLALHFNYNHEDPVTREIIHNKNFRIGLSHAIDRDEINELVYAGLGQPWQVAPVRDSAFFDEQFATQYTEYDVDLANEYLDRAGYTQRDSQGFRLGPDGNRISLTVEVVGAHTERVDQLELIQGYWREVGVSMELRTMDRSLLWERKDNALHDIMAWGGDGGLNPIMAPQRYIPDRGGSHQAVRWAAWYNNPDDPFAEEPPDSVKRKLELLDKVKAEGNPDRQAEYMRQALAIARDSFRLIGTVQGAPGYKIVRNDFHNVPDSMPGSWMYPTPGPTNPEQYFTTRGR